ncbi:MAG: DNA topoisomerase IV [Nonlabens sp.]
MRFLLLSVLLLSFSNCYENPRECTDFRTGTFEWTQESGGKLLTTTFKRTEEYQIETYEGVTDTSKVEWVNDCEWRIIPIDPKTNAESRAYLFKIMRTDEDSYDFEFTQSGRDQIYKGTAKKVE